MKVVYKYPFEVSDEVQLRLPRYTDILKIDVQRGQPCMWVLQDNEMPLETRKFRIVGTGHSVEDVEFYQHIDTFFQGPFVWHVFEI